jgi:hypothetical protein
VRFRGRTELALLPLHIEVQVNLSFEAQPSFLFSQSVSSVCPTKRPTKRPAVVKPIDKYLLAER